MGSNALTLGRARGAAILGQPLELTVPVQFAADEDNAGLCFETDVYYGENRQESSRVTVTADTPASGQAVVVRISSRLPVDEPVVTLYLRSTCGVKASRKYVLLADLVSELATPAAATSPVRPSLPAALPPVVSVTTEGKPADAGGPPKPGKMASVPSATRATSKVGKVPGSAPTSSAVALPEPSGGSRARLKLAPLDLSQDWDPNLKNTPDLISVPTEDADKRIVAAALWRSLNLTPEEVLRDDARLQGLEQNVQKLSDLTAQNQRQMQTLMARLEKADAQRYANPLVYGLVAAVLALAGLLLWGWRRWRNADAGAPWWRGEVAVQEAPASIHASAAVSVGAGPLPATHEEQPFKRPELRTQPRGPVVQALASVDIDLQLDDVPPSAAAPISRSAPMSRTPADRTPSRMTGLRDFHSSMSGSLRSINTQEVLDVRQQAEFFMTLGQYDDAIALLENSIHDNAESNPLVYLDLLKALHTLSRKEAFDRYRDEFNAVFTGQVPIYTQFSQPGRGLDAYPELCGHMASLWPSKAALEFIEKCMVREANAAAVVNFDLEAFRELLLLHAVLTRLSEASESALMPFSAAKPAVTEASEADAAPVAAAPMEVDFEISDIEKSPSHNLIEFEAPDVSVTPPSPDTRP